MLVLDLPVGDGVFLKTLMEEQDQELFELIDKNRDHLRRFMPWVDERGKAEDAKAFIEGNPRLSIYDPTYPFGIWKDGRLCGIVSFVRGERDIARVEIGYWLGSAFTGMGIMTKAVRTMIDYAFEQDDVSEVMVNCAAQNLASQGIPERLGIPLVEILSEACSDSGEMVDGKVYIIAKEDWTK